MHSSSRTSGQAEPFRRKNLAVYVGGLIVLLGLVLNVSTIQWMLHPIDAIPPGSRRVLLVRFVEALLIGLGALVLIKKPRVTIVHLSALALVSNVCTIVGLIALEMVYVPTPILSGWRSVVPATELNELGFRGRAIRYSADDFVILMLGDSQVEAMALPFDAMPERLLESDLSSVGRPVKVFSVGTGGYGQDQELLALEEYLQRYRADLVVLWQTPKNDVWNNVFNTHMGNNNPKPTFWLERGQLRGPNETFGQQLAASPIVMAAMWQRIVSLKMRDNNWEARLPEPYVSLQQYDGPVNHEWQDNWNANIGWMRYENLDTEKSHMAVMLTPRSKRMDYGLQLTHALVDRIQQVIRSKGGELLVLQVDDHPFNSDQDEVYVLKGKYYRVSKRQFNENWRVVTEGFNREIVPVTVKDWRVSVEDGHLNRPANEQVMKDLAQRLRCRIGGRQDCRQGQPPGEF